MQHIQDLHAKRVSPAFLNEVQIYRPATAHFSSVTGRSPPAREHRMSLVDVLWRRRKRQLRRARPVCRLGEAGAPFERAPSAGQAKPGPHSRGLRLQVRRGRVPFERAPSAGQARPGPHSRGLRLNAANLRVEKAPYFLVVAHGNVSTKPSF